MFLKPTYVTTGDITTLDIELLCNDGIKGLIIDLDSTLMESGKGRITTETDAWLQLARPRLKMIVLTNNKRQDYIDNAGSVLNMPVIGYAAKPWKAGFRQALAALELPPEEVAVIGDRPLTDIWGGRRSNMRTVLVRPLSSIVEPSWKTFFRQLEHVFIRR
ncbi:MAG: YqeG family HAD IIIA-type phosphatase [Candidatus Obscuribacterales bacterium]|nr:YqeG family HAD IIIA-type phosphatase [Candidatus Obscuribacterales bacterium]